MIKIKELRVETVETYKSLGTMFDFSLKFDKNTEAIVKQGQQRIYLWQKLNSFNVSQSFLCNFYYCFIESLVTFSFVCWFYGLSIKEKNSLSSIITVCSKIIGLPQENASGPESQTDHESS